MASKKESGLKREFDAATGKASFEQVKATLLAIPAESLTHPNLDLQSAAMAGLVLVDRARQAERAPRFALLPAAIFAKGTVDDLERLCQATLHIDVETRREATATTGVKVDLALVQEASEVRERMQKTAEYNLGHLEAVARELADIRLGTGYLDLAND
jgi:hypothetical protein